MLSSPQTTADEGEAWWKDLAPVLHDITKKVD